MSGAEAKAAMTRRRPPLADRVLNVTGNDWGGSHSPPLSNRKIYVCEDGQLYRVFSMQDDGGFVGIGYPDEWHVIMRTEAARAFALWTLWVWACDWFGLRAAIYYRALNAHLGRGWRLDYKRRGRWRKHVALSSYDDWLNNGHRR